MLTLSQAAHAAGCSPSALRGYCKREDISAFFDAQARPATGAPRLFTDADIVTIAYIRRRTQEAATYALIVKELTAGEHRIPPQPPQEATGQPPAELITLATVEALRMMLADAQRREAEAQERVEKERADALERDAKAQARIVELERELGRAEGQLTRPPGFWQRLFGQRQPTTGG